MSWSVTQNLSLIPLIWVARVVHIPVFLVIFCKYFPSLLDALYSVIFALFFVVVVTGKLAFVVTVSLGVPNVIYWCLCNTVHTICLLSFWKKKKISQYAFFFKYIYISKHLKILHAHKHRYMHTLKHEIQFCPIVDKLESRRTVFIFSTQKSRRIHTFALNSKVNVIQT